MITNRVIRFFTRIPLIVAVACLLVQAVTVDEVDAVENGDVRLDAPNWSAYVGSPTWLPWSREQACTGSVIARYWVLTAGHCFVRERGNIPSVDVDGDGVDDTTYEVPPVLVGDPEHVAFQYQVAPPSDFAIVTGRGDLDGTDGHERAVDHIKLHPRTKVFGRLVGSEHPCTAREYVGYQCKYVVYSNQDFDIALLHLKDALPQGTSTVALASTRPANSSDVSYLGYGSVNRDGDQSRQLRVTQPNSYRVSTDCARTAEQFCADPVGNSRVLPGDSGGPWVQGELPDAVQYGVHHGGPPDNSQEQAVAVADVRGWIAQEANIPSDDGPGASDSNSVAMALIIDSSGSMNSNDRSDRRIDAGKAYLTAATASDAVGVVDFDSGVRIASEAVNPKTERTQLEQALESIDSNGGTNIGAGIQGGCDVLTGSGSQPVKAAILLTDGDGSYGGQNSCFKSNGWRLYTFGLGSSVNDSLLTTIADETGGHYKSLSSVDDLVCEFPKIRATVAGSAGSPCGVPDLIELGQTIVKRVPISTRLLQAVFSISWPGSDIGMTLVSPSGRRITVNSDDFDVSGDAGDTFKTISVYKPEPGEWQVEMVGIDVDAGGEPVSLSTSEVPLANQLPIATMDEFGLLDPATGTFEFGADGSRDPDGRIVDYLWDFGDGLAGVGEKVQHQFAKPGTYSVSLTVVDNDLETATIEREIEVATLIAPVRFALAGRAGSSSIYATGIPTDGGTEGTVYGVVDGRPLPRTLVTEAGLTTIDGEQVLVVRFLVDEEPWELRFYHRFWGIGVLEVCDPTGECESGTGVNRFGDPSDAAPPPGASAEASGALVVEPRSRTSTTPTPDPTTDVPADESSAAPSSEGPATDDAPAVTNAPPSTAEPTPEERSDSGSTRENSPPPTPTTVEPVPEAEPESPLAEPPAGDEPDEFADHPARAIFRDAERRATRPG